MAQKTEQSVEQNKYLQRPLYVFDLPEEILATLQLKPELNTSLSLVRDDDDGTNAEALAAVAVSRISSDGADGNSTKAATISCALCKLDFSTVQEQRNHVRSDLHSYNLKQKLRGQTAVSGNEFDKLVGELEEDLSGSDSGADTSSDDDDESEDGGAAKKKKAEDSTLSALLRKQANITDPGYLEQVKQRKMTAGKPPLLWFSSDALPRNYSLGVYRALFTVEEQALDSKALVDVLKKKQLSSSLSVPPAKQQSQKKSTAQDEDTDTDTGGVALPKQAPTPASVGPHYFLCMIGGGHFAASIISLTPTVTRRNGLLDRSATVVAHKTFHRYTTRRKQGGSQSSNDASKGNAHSAGAGIRRYNESALVDDVRGLLSGWRDMISTSELWFIRATGSTNRKTLFEQYEGRVLESRDKRIRGFPFSTKRATQKELVRAFVELTRLKTSYVDEDALRKKIVDDQAAREQAAITSAQKEHDQRVARERAKEENKQSEEQILHTTQLQSLIRRHKAPALLSYLTSNSLPADYLFYPREGDTKNYHAPTPLHLAASLNSAVCVSALLTKAGADPTLKSGEGKPAFDLAGDRATRDAFRLARHELGEQRWPWETTGIPPALTPSEVEARAAREKQEAAADLEAEAKRRKEETERLRVADREKEEADRDKQFGKGKSLGILGEVEKAKTAQEKREEEARGMTGEMRVKLERERRARAAEARFAKK